MNTKVKVASFTWWIFSLIGLFIGLANSDAQYVDSQPIVMGFVGIVNGALIGWLFGFIIDKIKDSRAVQNIFQKVEDTKKEKEILIQTNYSLNEYNDAKHRFQFLSDETLIEKYKSYVDVDVSDMQRLALEEELVKRKIIKHSPMHEKIEKVMELLKS